MPSIPGSKGRLPRIASTSSLWITWGDMGRCGEMQGDIGEILGDIGEIQGEDRLDVVDVDHLGLGLGFLRVRVRVGFRVVLVDHLGLG